MAKKYTKSGSLEAMPAKELLRVFSVDESTGRTVTGVSTGMDTVGIADALRHIDPWDFALVCYAFVALAPGADARYAALALAAFLIRLATVYWQRSQVRRQDELRLSVVDTLQVRRNGMQQSLTQTAIEPGDIVLLSPGDRVLVTLRLVKVRGLRVDQAQVDGNDYPVHKSVIGEPGVTTVFPGSRIVSGSAVAVCISPVHTRHPKHIRRTVALSSLVLFILSCLVLPLVKGSNDAVTMLLPAALVGASVAPLAAGLNSLQRHAALARSHRELAGKGIWPSYERLRLVAGCDTIVFDGVLLRDESETDREARFRLGAESGIALYAVGVPSASQRQLLNEGHWISLASASNTARELTARIAALRRGRHRVLAVNVDDATYEAMLAADEHVVVGLRRDHQRAAALMTARSFDGVRSLVIAVRRLIVSERHLNLAVRVLAVLLPFGFASLVLFGTSPLFASALSIGAAVVLQALDGSRTLPLVTETKVLRKHPQQFL